MGHDVLDDGFGERLGCIGVCDARPYGLMKADRARIDRSSSLEGEGGLSTQD